MSRFVTVSLDKRGVSCVARLLDDARAPDMRGRLGCVTVVGAGVSR